MLRHNLFGNNRIEQQRLSLYEIPVQILIKGMMTTRPKNPLIVIEFHVCRSDSSSVMLVCPLKGFCINKIVVKFIISKKPNQIYFNNCNLINPNKHVLTKLPHASSSSSSVAALSWSIQPSLMMATKIEKTANESCSTTTRKKKLTAHTNNQN
ncbi:hypothetical protein FF38_05699 [Lucilia cuprina]|uniref:Uncharacterized protein n=1 Tax=Lucilia cuprina TaxID=7375 RepID=A0A0L0C8L6_LUCCU|nr:hypothetical protein FF38_05699 [Lucilia cuprina]